MTVAVESLSPSELPVIVTMSEWMRRMKDMARSGGGGYAFMGNMPDSYNVAVNANHGIVQKIIKAEGEEQKTKLAKQAYDLALLSQNMLTGADLTSFIKRSVELVS
jgi:molecular chaperone HtpG